MRVVVINIVALNPGDAAILQGTLEILHRAFGDNVSVTVFDRDGAAAAQYYPWAEFRPSLFDLRRRGRIAGMANRRGYGHRVYRADALRFRLGAALLARGRHRLAATLLSVAERDALQAYRAADLVISNGGTYLVPHYNMLRPILDCELALELGRILVFFPQSLGPFDTTRFRPRLHRIFARALRVIGRDERSAQHLRELQVPEEKILVCADAAFALSLLAPPAREPALPPVRPRFAISVRKWAHFTRGDPAAMQARYMAAIAALARQLVRRHGADVTFISTCQGMAEYWTDDSVCAREIADTLEPDVAAHVHVDTAFRQPVALMQELAGFDAVVATRMHVAILALCAGVPVLPIAYEFKTRELFRAMGMEEWVTDIEDADAATFVPHGDRFVENLSDLRSQVSTAVAERRAQTLQLADTLRQAVRRS